MAARSPSAHLPDAVDVHIHAVVPAGPLQLVLLHPELEGLANITAPKPSGMSTELEGLANITAPKPSDMSTELEGLANITAPKP
eukprot:478764-Prorocentrum_minimum.AAC.2